MEMKLGQRVRYTNVGSSWWGQTGTIVDAMVVDGIWAYQIESDTFEGFCFAWTTINCLEFI